MFDTLRGSIHVWFLLRVPECAVSVEEIWYLLLFVCILQWLLLTFVCGSGGSWTGRAAIAGYQFLLLILLIALILAYIYGNAWLADVKTAIDELHANPASDPDYSMPEAVIRDYFNKLFFTAIQSCKSKRKLAILVMFVKIRSSLQYLSILFR